jgi:hypothetical protein
MKVSDLLPIIHLPWKDTEQVEVLISPLCENDEDVKLERVKGALSKYANKDLIQFEKDAWANSVEEKYGNAGY